MSDTLAQPTQKSIDYMVRLLQMNPVQQCDEIISARSSELGQPNKAESARLEAVKAKSDRQSALARLDELRADFWSLPLDALQDRLTQLDTHGYADVAAAVARLRMVAAHREEFPKLSAKLGMDRYFADSLKDILTKPPREVATLREHELASLNDKAQRKLARRFVKLVKRQMPAIYNLESDWLESIYRQKAHGRTLVKSRGAAPALSGLGGRRSYWWLGIVIVAIIRLVSSMADQNQRATKMFQPSDGWKPQSSWQPSRAPLPTFLPESSPSALRKTGENTPVPSFGKDKGIWEPFGSPYAPESHDQPNFNAQRSIDIVLPTDANSSGPASKADDRYSR
jgi:hypothetical protein